MTEIISPDIQNYIEKRANIRTTIINYLDGDENLEKDFNILKYFNEQKVQEPTIFDLKKILDFIRIIIDNHHQSPDFFTKIMEIITYFKDDIKKTLTNKEFFDIFSTNNKILYLLFEKNLIQPEESIIEILKKPSKMDYFEPVIEMYHTNQPFDDYDEKMREKRKNGENDSQITQMIRNDSVEEFIQYITANNYPPNSKINQCYFETNSLLKKKDPTFIEYAAFYGSIQIFNYLKNSGVDLTPSLWIYVIHSKNAELIHRLEENDVQPEGENYDNCIIEAIKCHHNDIANYLLDQNNQKKMKYLLYYLTYDNYELISTDLDSYSDCNLKIEDILAILKSHSEFLNLLYKESYIDINYKYRNKSLFSLAFTMYDIDLIKFLLSIPNIDPNDLIENGKTALIISVEKNDTELIKLLLDCPNINPNAMLFKYKNVNGRVLNCRITALTIAIEKGNDEIIQLLLQNKNIDPNFYLEDHLNERTLLSEAIKNNDIKLIKLLLSCPNIDPNVIHRNNNTNDKLTPLAFAIEKESKEIIDILLSNDKIIPNSKLLINYECKTELLIAIEKGNDEIIQLLLQNEKVDPNFIFNDKNYEERTVLSMAVEEDNVKLTKMLLSCPNINIYTQLKKKITYQGETKSTNTIMNLALYKNNKDIINLFFECKRRHLSK